MNWGERAAAAIDRHEGETWAADQRGLAQRANAAWAAGLCLLMDGRREEASAWLVRAADGYRQSWEAGAPPDSWGRPIAATKALLLAGEDATAAAHWALVAGAVEAPSPIGRYAGTLALLVLEDDFEARVLAATLRDRDDFPRDVADALAALAAGDGTAYRLAVEEVLASFERRDGFLGDVPVADTVLVLQRLAAERGFIAQLPASALLPAERGTTGA